MVRARPGNSNVPSALATSGRARASTVATTMIRACVLIVRRAWVPGSDDRHQSTSPVRAASTDTAAPPMNT